MYRIEVTIYPGKSRDTTHAELYEVGSHGQELVVTAHVTAHHQDADPVLTHARLNRQIVLVCEELAENFQQALF